MTRTLALSFAVSLLSLPAASQEATRPTPTPVVIHTAEAPGLKVFFLNVPWGPSTFATMQMPGDSFYNKRSWPFARLEAANGFTLDGTQVPAGNYALVFHPNTPDNAGMSLELRKVEVAEFLQPGNAMTPTPEGTTVLKAPVRFDLATSTAPALKLEFAPDKDGTKLRVHYGDRLLIKDLKQ